MFFWRGRSSVRSVGGSRTILYRTDLLSYRRKHKKIFPVRLRMLSLSSCPGWHRGRWNTGVGHLEHGKIGGWANLRTLTSSCKSITRPNICPHMSALPMKLELEPRYYGLRNISEKEGSFEADLGLLVRNLYYGLLSHLDVSHLHPHIIYSGTLGTSQPSRTAIAPHCKQCR